MEKKTLFVGLFIGMALAISCGLVPTPTPTPSPIPIPTSRPSPTATLEGIATEAPVTVTDEELLAVIQKNLEAAQDEDTEAYMATIHPDSPAYAATQQAMQSLFEQYDVSYKLESVEVVSKTNTEAQVRVVQLTKKVSGPAFRDNRITAVHTLWKSDGAWKVYGTTIENVEYLN